MESLVIVVPLWRKITVKAQEGRNKEFDFKKVLVVRVDVP